MLGHAEVITHFVNLLYDATTVILHYWHGEKHFHTKAKNIVRTIYSRKTLFTPFSLHITLM